MQYLKAKLFSYLRGALTKDIYRKEWDISSLKFLSN